MDRIDLFSDEPLYTLDDYKNYLKKVIDVEDIEGSQFNIALIRIISTLFKRVENLEKRVLELEGK